MLAHRVAYLNPIEHDHHLGWSMSLRFLVCSLLVLLLLTASATSQLNTSMEQDTTGTAQKSADYDYLFPIFGKDLIARGFDLPYPVGLNIIGIGITQPITLSDFRLSFGEGVEPQPFPIVQFGDAQSTIYSLNTRFDLWLFPFLNVYGLYGVAQANTEVTIAQPVEFTSSVDQTGKYYGVGLTTAFGVFDHWASVDLNWTWSDLELLDEPVLTRIVGIRLGHTFPLTDDGQKLAAWIGLMNAEIAVTTAGSVKLSDAMPPEAFARLDSVYANYQSSDWYGDMPKWQQVAVDSVMGQLQAGSEDRRNLVVNYDMLKALAAPTNLLLGAQWEISKAWIIRAEAGLIGRWSVLLNLNYRFRL